MSSKDLEIWACKELDKMGLPDAGLIIQYLGPLEEPKEVEDYLSSMLDISQKKHRDFIVEFMSRQAESKVDKNFYRKADDADLSLQGNKSQGKKKGKASNSDVVDPPKEKTNKNNSNGSKIDNSINEDKENKQNSESNLSGKKKKNKFVNLYTDDDVVMLSGRNVCECLASKHNLVNNCLSCGRIVCEQEGAGPCFFCGNVVKGKDGEGDNTKQSNEKKNGKGKSTKSSNLEKAVEHKNRLLEFDRTSEKRTQVLDDECDYFNSESRWISPEDRKILQEKEKELKEKKYGRSNKKLAIDLLGRKVVEEESNDGVYDPDDPIVKAILEKQQSDIFTESEKHSVAPPASLIKPVYVTKEPQKNFSVNSLAMSPVGEVSKHINRLQDKELQEMADQGKCLSMHQPWASLLIAGIKLHEGRTWYSAHRGRLWIASTAKDPISKDIEDLENHYRMWGEDESNDSFPKYYPPGCLLGCVDVVDVLPQEEYRIKFPEGESDSPFVFICERPREMIFKFPMKGQHKIFSLDGKLHQAAAKALK